MNVEFETPLDVTTILNGLVAGAGSGYSDPILTGGETIYGVYTSTEIGGDADGVCRTFELNFVDQVGYTAYTVPALGTKVYVKYDKRIPVRVFGGDTYINESTWAPIDNVWEGGAGDPSDTDGGWIYPSNEFIMDCSWPLKQYGIEDSWFLWENADQGGNTNYETYDMEFANPSGSAGAMIRQLVLAWTAETRYNLSFAFNVEAPDKAVSDQYYPLIN